MDKKKNQLGMNPSTANGRLLKDLLFAFVVKEGHKCFRCGEEMSRETFSIEHKVPWLDSINPVELFFDLDNIAYSHLSCNVGAARKQLASHGTRSSYQRGCHCPPCTQADTSYARDRYDPEARRSKYINTGY